MKTVWIEKPFEIAVTDTQKPVPKEGEALLKVLYCGICGADVASYTGNQPLRLIPEFRDMSLVLRLCLSGKMTGI